MNLVNMSKLSISEAERHGMALSMAIVLTYFEPTCFESQSYTATDICAWFQNHLSTNRLRSQYQPFTIPDFAIFCDHLKLALTADDKIRAFIKERCPTLR